MGIYSPIPALYGGVITHLRVVTRVRTDTGAEVHKSAAISLANSMASSPTLEVVKESQCYQEGSIIGGQQCRQD